MLLKNSKWFVCYWDSQGDESFARFDNKEEVMTFIDQQLEQYGGVMNDFEIFPPGSSITKDEIAFHNVPEIFKPRR